MSTYPEAELIGIRTLWENNAPLMELVFQVLNGELEGEKVRLLFGGKSFKISIAGETLSDDEEPDSSSQGEHTTEEEEADSTPTDDEPWDDEEE